MDKDLHYDEYCFLYVVCRHLFPETRSFKDVAQFRPYFDRFNLKHLRFPLKANQVPKFVRQNAHHPLTVRLLYFVDNQTFPSGVYSNLKEGRETDSLFVAVLKETLSDVEEDPEIPDPPEGGKRETW